MDDKFKVYDQICTTITQWLMSNIQHHPEPLCITDIGINDKQDLCILSILNYVQYLTDKSVQYSGNFITYLILKYIKKFKYLHYCHATINMFILNLPEFEREVMLFLGQKQELLEEIYDTYYAR